MERVYDEVQIRQDYQKLTRMLIERNLSITTMESATSGQIASLITDTEGASAIFRGAFVTYCNEAKIRQGVSAETIERYSVYSKETAAAMAEACRKAYQADIGIGVTGTMGNIDPANAEVSTPGTLYFALCMGAETTCYQVELAVQPCRLMYKLAAAKEIADALFRQLEAIDLAAKESGNTGK